ncbi:MAG: hypothetical protein HYS09_10530 [Chloroflexi bacterium]|nr:hypothetical protein [Chloroflexota bacterium]
MRYVIPLVALLALLAACGGGAGPPQGTPTPSRAAAPGSPIPTASASPGAPGEVDVRDLALRPQDVPGELGQLGRPQVFTAEEFFADQLTSGEITEADIADWGVLSAALQVYNSPPQPYPAEGAQLMAASVVLHGTADGAEAFLAVAREDLDRSRVEELEAFPGRELLEYQDLAVDQLPGDEARFIRYVSDGAARLEAYEVIFRRDRVSAHVQVRAPEGNVSLEQVVGIAQALDSRIQDGLG